MPNNSLNLSGSGVAREVHMGANWPPWKFSEGKSGRKRKKTREGERERWKEEKKEQEEGKGTKNKYVKSDKFPMRVAPMNPNLAS